MEVGCLQVRNFCTPVDDILMVREYFSIPRGGSSSGADCVLKHGVKESHESRVFRRINAWGCYKWKKHGGVDPIDGRVDMVTNIAKRGVRGVVHEFNLV